MINIPAQVVVSTSGQTALVTVPNGPCQVVIQNNDATNYITIGDKNVTATHGYELDPGKSLTFSTFPGSTGATLYGVANTANVNVSILVSTPQ